MKNILNDNINKLLIFIFTLIIIFNAYNYDNNIENFINIKSIKFDFDENREKINKLNNYIATTYFNNIIQNKIDISKPETIDIDTLNTINGKIIQNEINNMQDHINNLTINNINYLLAYAEFYKSYFNYIITTSNNQSKKLKLETYIIIINAAIEKLIATYINLKQYYFNPDLATWEQHNKNAHNVGYDGLVCIQNKAELDHIKQLIPSNINTIWIGGEKKDNIPSESIDGSKSDNYWKWSDKSLWNTNGYWNDNSEIWTNDPLKQGTQTRINNKVGIKMNSDGKWSDELKNQRFPAIYQKVNSPGTNNN